MCEVAMSRRSHDQRIAIDTLLTDIAALSDLSYPSIMSGMKGITIKLPEAVAQRLREQARQSGRSIAALIRERIEMPPRAGESIYSVSADLAGSLDGRRVSATNARKRFK